MPTEDRNTIDCTFQHSSLDIQFLNPSIPPSKLNIPAPPPPFPAFCFPCPNISSLGSNRRLLSPSFTRSIPTFHLSCSNIPPLGPSYIPSPKSSIPTSRPYNQSNIPSASAFHPFNASIPSLSPPVPTFQPFKPLFSPISFQCTHSTQHMQLGKGSGAVSSHWQVRCPWENLGR